MAPHQLVCESGGLGLWLYTAPSDAAIARTTANLNLRARPSLRCQFNRTFAIRTLR